MSKTSPCLSSTRRRSRNPSLPCCPARIRVYLSNLSLISRSELFFDQSIEYIFVNRVAGNLVTPDIIGSLEYGAAVLGTKVILVMGHSNCGAVKATIQGKEVPGQISSLFPHIRPAVDQAGSDLVAATQANAKIQATLLRQASTVIAGLVKSGSVKVAAAYYDLGTGGVKLLD